MGLKSGRQGSKHVQALVAHQKQFVLGPEAVRVRPEWEALQLADRLILSLCPKLRISKLQSRDGKDYYLLGLAVPADTLPQRSSAPSHRNTLRRSRTGPVSGPASGR